MYHIQDAAMYALMYCACEACTRRIHFNVVIVMYDQYSDEMNDKCIHTPQQSQGNRGSLKDAIHRH